MTAAERQRKHVRALERTNEKQAAEIQRLRAAMVHAMNDCESALRSGDLGPQRTFVQAAYTALKVTLEKP